MEPDAQSRLAKLRAKHESLRMKSIQKIEQAKNSLENKSDSGDDQTINILSSECIDISSAVMQSMAESSQHKQELQSLSSATVSLSASDAALTVNKDLLPGKGNWSGASLPPTSRLGKGEHPSLDESAEEIPHKSSSSKQHYPPIGKQERLLAVFEFDRTLFGTQNLDISNASLSVASTNSSVSVEPLRPAVHLSIEGLLQRPSKVFQESLSSDDDNVEAFTNQGEDDFEVTSADDRMAKVIRKDDTSSDSSGRSEVGTNEKKTSVKRASCNSGSEADDLDAAKVAEYEAYLMQMSTKSFYGDSSDDNTNLCARNSKDNSASVSGRSSSSSSYHSQSNRKKDGWNAGKVAENERYLMQMSTKSFYGERTDDDTNLESRNSKDDESSVSSSGRCSSSSSSPSSCSVSCSKKSEGEPRGNPISANADAVKVAQYEAYLMQMSTRNFDGDDSYDTGSQDDFKSGNNFQKQLVLPLMTNWVVSSSEDEDGSTVSNGGPATPTFLKKPFKPWFKEVRSTDVASSRDGDSLVGDTHPNFPLLSDTESNDSQFEVASHSAEEANYEVASNNSDGDDDISTNSGKKGSKLTALDVGKVTDYDAYLMQLSTKKFYGDNSDDDVDLRDAQGSCLNVARVKNESIVVDTDIANAVSVAEHEAYLMRMSVQAFSCFSNNGDE